MSSNIITPNAEPKCYKCVNFVVIKGISGSNYPRCLLSLAPIIIQANAVYVDVLECPLFESRDDIKTNIIDPAFNNK